MVIRLIINKFRFHFQDKNHLLTLTDINVFAHIYSSIKPSVYTIPFFSWKVSRGRETIDHPKITKPVWKPHAHENQLFERRKKKFNFSESNYQFVLFIEYYYYRRIRNRVTLTARNCNDVQNYCFFFFLLSSRNNERMLKTNIDKPVIIYICSIC